MKVVIKKGTQRNQLIFTRDDGSVEFSNIGPSLPHHDLAHYVSETNLQLKNGFYDNVARGYSVGELGDKEVIKTLGYETWVAEVSARALQSLSSGACKIEQFGDLVNSELKAIGAPELTSINAALVHSMLNEFKQLLSDFEDLNSGDTIELNYKPN